MKSFSSNLTKLLQLMHECSKEDDKLEMNPFISSNLSFLSFSPQTA
jgi:hypothetical protein